MRFSAAALLSAAWLCAAHGPARAGERDPGIGYLYPAGGRQGTTVSVTAGGQFLRDASGVNLLGTGVNVVSVKFVPPLSFMQLQELGRRIAERRAKLTGMPFGPRQGPAKKEAPPPTKTAAAEKKPAGDKKDTTPAKKAEAGKKEEPKPVELPPDHPWVKDLEKKSLSELKSIANLLLLQRKQQQKRSIAELAIMELRIDSNAPPGNRELRVETPAGLTNPLCFQVGTLREINELEPNDPDSPAAAAVDTPVLINGQIMPGDVDRFRFRARRGQRLVIEAQARQLIPYIADAVPGWFQALLTLYDARGCEVGFADDYRTNPDPVLFYEVPQDGEYTIEVRDSIYRGREDFVYRLSVAERPFVTQVFPLGGKAGADVSATVSGWNVPTNRIKLDTRPGPDLIRQTAPRWPNGLANSLCYAVEDLPESDENEPNDAPLSSLRVAASVVVNGRIGKPGDVDIFRLDGRGNSEIVAEVFARRLGSPLDALLRVTDASGAALAWNDDTEDKGSGLNTHHADSYVRCKLPRDGACFVQLSDAQGHGGDEYAYRLRMGPPRPDFALRVTPSGINASAGCAVPITVWALRKDGFAGEIQVALKNAPAGFALDGGTIPEGRDSVRMTLTAPRDRTDRPVALQMEGRARINGQAVSRPAVPAEDMMQAFDYRHLVPAERLLAVVARPRFRAPALELADALPVRIPAGGSAKVRFKAPLRMTFVKVSLELSDPPAGVTADDVRISPGYLTFVLKADGQKVKPGYADNLIAEAFAEVAVPGADPKAPKTTRRVSLGVLPAIPFCIVAR